MNNFLTKHYHIQDATLVPMALGFVNQNFRVDANGSSYALKRYSMNSYDLSEIERSAAVQARMGAAGVPVPAIIPNRSGDLITQEDGTCYILSAFVEGHHYERGEMPPEAARQMGRAHGQLTRALGEVKPVQPYSPPDPAKAISALEQVLRLAEQGMTPVDATVVEILQYKIGAIERIAPVTKRFSDLQVQWVHGDYQDTNVLFGAEDRVVALLDFDNLRCRPRGYEVMRAFAYSFGEGAERAYDYFRGFAEEYRPSRDEVADYAPLWTYVELTRMWPIDTRYLRPEAYQERWNHFIKPPTGWWERNWERVADRLLALL